MLKQELGVLSLLTLCAAVMLLSCDDETTPAPQPEIDGVEEQDGLNDEEQELEELDLTDAELDQEQPDEVEQPDLPDETEQLEVPPDATDWELPDDVTGCLESSDCEGCQTCQSVPGLGRVCVDALQPECTPGDHSCGEGEYCRAYRIDQTGCGGSCELITTHPQCEARGGTCRMVGWPEDNCPLGEFAPFSGEWEDCRAAIFQVCCVQNGNLGSPCQFNADCIGMGCLSQNSGYPPDGVCTTACNPAEPTCPSNGRCVPVDFAAAPGICLNGCDRDDACREGWSCEAFPSHLEASGPSHFACWGVMPGITLMGFPCASDSDCLSGLCHAQRCSAYCDGSHPCKQGYDCVEGRCVF